MKVFARPRHRASVRRANVQPCGERLLGPGAGHSASARPQKSRHLSCRLFDAGVRCMPGCARIGVFRAEWHPVWWPARSSKPLFGGDPVEGRFDSYAAPPLFLQGFSSKRVLCGRFRYCEQIARALLLLNLGSEAYARGPSVASSERCRVWLRRPPASPARRGNMCPRSWRSSSAPVFRRPPSGELRGVRTGLRGRVEDGGS